VAVDVNIYLDMEKFGEAFAESVTFQASVKAQQVAQNRVRVDFGTLKGSIEAESDETKGFVGSDLPYAAAQEYGLPGTKYGFTPYLRPAAQEAAMDADNGKFDRQAAIIAARKAKR
jgi:phage gpG-like protein